MPSPTRDAAPEVRLVPLSELHPSPWNPRTVKTTAFKALCASLEADPEFLWRRPILANLQGEVLAGNQRYRAAEVLGWSAVPAVVEDVPDRLARERALRDNNSAGEYQEQELAELLYGLQQDGGALEALAFDKGEVDRLLASVGVGGRAEAPEAEVDRAEELREKWAVEPGQLWEIGRHRLLCGDATKPKDVERVLAGARPRLMVTDPPYGVGYEPGWRDATVGLTHRRVGRVTNDDRGEWGAAWALTPCDVAYVWHYWLEPEAILSGLRAAHFEPRMHIVWAKARPVISRGHYNGQHECCWYAVRQGAAAGWIGDHSQSSLWSVGGDSTVDGEHGTQKPVECMARPLRNHEGDVYDPFVGAGTTAVAAELHGRTCYALDIDPKYVAVTLERLSKMGLVSRLVEP